MFDEEARKLNGAERFALAHYCQVTAQQIGTSHRLHTHIQNALKITDLYWDQYLETQGTFLSIFNKENSVIKIYWDQKKESTHF